MAEHQITEASSSSKVIDKDEVKTEVKVETTEVKVETKEVKVETKEENEVKKEETSNNQDQSKENISTETISSPKKDISSPREDNTPQDVEPLSPRDKKESDIVTILNPPEDAMVLYDFVAQRPKHLGVKKGTVVKISEIRKSWWTASYDDKNGTIPANYVTFIKDKVAAVALFDFNKGESSMLKFSKGDNISVWRQGHDGWSIGSHKHRENLIGAFPTNFIYIGTLPTNGHEANWTAALKKNESGFINKAESSTSQTPPLAFNLKKTSASQKFLDDVNKRPESVSPTIPETLPALPTPKVSAPAAPTAPIPTEPVPRIPETKRDLKESATSPTRKATGTTSKTASNPALNLRVSSRGTIGANSARTRGFAYDDEDDIIKSPKSPKLDELFQPLEKPKENEPKYKDKSPEDYKSKEEKKVKKEKKEDKKDKKR